MSETEERKTVSVLFCDLVGFTARSDQADPEDVGALLRPYHAMLRAVLTRFGGTVEKFIGDAVMAVFGAPTSREDDAERATRAGLAILAAIRELDSPGSNQLAVRIGIATGEVLVALEARPLVGEGMVFGDAVNTAARLQTVAPTGAVVIDELTRALTQDAIDSRPLQPVAVKGKAKPLRIWQVTDARPKPRLRPAPTTPFVGRSTQLQVLRNILNDVIRDRRCRLVTIVGQPGVGKSRLVEELRSAVDARAMPALWLRGHCPAYGDVVALPAISEIVKGAAEILDTDDRDSAQSKLYRAVSDVIDDATDAGWIAAMLSALVGLATGDKSADRQERFTGWRRYLEALARRRPLVLHIEDLHWSDPATLEFLDHLRLRCHDVPLCLIATTRPEFLDRIPDFGGDEAAARLAVPALDSQHTSRLINGLLGDSVLPPETQVLLLKRSAGVPLYAEQFVRLLKDSGRIDANGAGITRDASQQLAVPGTVQALLAARLDTLGRHDKALLQASAVVGPALWPAAVAAAARAPENQVRDRLDELTRREFLHRRTRSSVAGQVEYRFSHELLREVGYAQIPRAARAHLHESVAAWWAEVAGDRLGEHAEVLAYHYGEALLFASSSGSDPPERLVLATRRFLVLAGDRATHLDPTAAERHYRRALELFPASRPERPAVLRRLAWVSGVVGHTNAAEEQYREAIEADLRLGDRRAAGNSMAELASLLLWDRGDTKSSRTLVGQAFQLLRDEGPCAELALALGSLAFAALSEGRPAETVEWASQIVGIADVTGLDEVEGHGLALRGMARLDLDDPDGIIDMRAAINATQAAIDKEGATNHGSWELLMWHANLVEGLWLVEGTAPALVAARRAEQLAENRGLLHSLSGARGDWLKVLFDAGRWDQLLRSAQTILDERIEQDVDYWTTTADIYVAKVLVERADVASAARLMDRVRPQARAIGDLQVLGPALEVAATLALGNGEVRHALDLVRELATATDQVPPRRAWHQPAITRVCAAAGDLALAERLLAGTDLRLLRHACAHSSAVAILAEARDDVDAAIDCFDRAASRWHHYGNPLEQAHALLGLARCVERRDSARAARAMRVADRLLTNLGAKSPHGVA